MSRLSLVILSVLALTSAALAQGAAYNSPPVTAINPYADAVDTTYLVPHRADCEPDAADPVWGPGQQLAGFSCFRTP